MLNPTDDRFALGRRSFLTKSFAGIGSFALATLMAENSGLATPAGADVAWPALPSLPHFAPRAKRIIHGALNIRTGAVTSNCSLPIDGIKKPTNASSS